MKRRVGDRGRERREALAPEDEQIGRRGLGAGVPMEGSVEEP